MVYRLILPDWIKAKPDYDPKVMPAVLEGKFTEDEVFDSNAVGYNCYYFPNYPSNYEDGTNVQAGDVDVFKSVFIDMDIKHGCHETKESFVAFVFDSGLDPSLIVDSGNGIHVYWHVSDLDGMTYLRLQRRLCRFFNTDEAVSKLCQLMRVPGTINWKNEQDIKKSEAIYKTDKIYTSEDLNNFLPKITIEDEAYCKMHFDKAHGLYESIELPDELPSKWFKLAKKGTEPWKLFYEQQKDRSKADYRLAHLMLAAGFTKEEAMTVLCQTSKATQRIGTHRFSYAENIVSKVWLHAESPLEASKILSRNVRDILEAAGDDETLNGKRFECDPIVDATEHGFRLTHVLGLIGGAGSGKTMFGLNLFRWFAQRNPNYIHLAVSLEQPELEYAQRWKKMVGKNMALYESVHILGNYNDDGTYRNLSLAEIEDYVKCLERQSGKKVGCVMIDHIGVLKKENRNGDTQSLIDICQYLKAFAVNTNTFLIIQSQTSREKAGIGDVELDKDAAFGTSNFEWFCDYIVTIWQPLKRVYADPEFMKLGLMITCFKFCKIRTKHAIKDKIKEDVKYALVYDPDTDLLRELTKDDHTSVNYYQKRATTLLNRDKKREPGPIAAIDWTKSMEVISNAGKPAASRGLGNAIPSQRLSTKS